MSSSSTTTYNSEDVTLDKLIDYFVEENIDEIAITSEAKQVQIHNYAKAKIRDTIVNDIRSEVKNDVIKEYEHKNKKGKFNDVIVLIVETVILAFLVGLLVNQLTDLINLSKGAKVNLTATLWWISGIFSLLIILVVVSTYSKLKDLYIYFNNKES